MLIEEIKCYLKQSRRITRLVTNFFKDIQLNMISMIKSQLLAKRVNLMKIELCNMNRPNLFKLIILLIIYLS